MRPGDEIELPVRRDEGFQRPKGLWGLDTRGHLKPDSWADVRPLLQSVLGVPREDLATWPKEGSKCTQHQSTLPRLFKGQDSCGSPRPH